MTAVDEFLAAARRGPPAALMAATSCLRPAPVATERMVAGARVVLDDWAVDRTPRSRIRLQMRGAIKLGLGSVEAMISAEGLY